MALLNWLRGTFAALFIAFNTALACVPLFAMALVRGLLPKNGREWMSGQMDWIIDYWVGCNRLLLRYANICQVQLQGLEAAQLNREQWHLVISNHQSWTDILILQTSLRPHLPPLKFFTKQQLIWLPFLGLAMYLLGFPYVRRVTAEQIKQTPSLKGLDRRSTLAACEGFKRQPTTILNFLEGTRFTKAKHQLQVSKGSPYKHLLQPRVGGMRYVLEGMGEQLDGIIDATIIYPTTTPPTFWDFLCGRCPTAQLSLVRHESRQAAGETENHDSLAAWVGQIWQDKDVRLDAEAAQRIV